MFTRKPESEVIQSPTKPPLIAGVTPSFGAALASSSKDGLHAPSAKENEEGLVVIGKGTTVHGTIGDCKILDVHGILQANVVADLVIVRKGGGIKGHVQTDRAEVHGVFEGTLLVHEHLQVEATGFISGEVSYRTLAIQTGAKLGGNIICSEPEHDIAAATTPVVDAAIPVPEATATIFQISNARNDDARPAVATAQPALPPGDLGFARVK